jgi:hypothetical protein
MLLLNTVRELVVGHKPEIAGARLLQAVNLTSLRLMNRQQRLQIFGQSTSLLRMMGMV